VKVVSIGIHPDDADMGSGGYLLLLSGQGWETVILDLTEGDKSTNGTVEERRAEAEKSSAILGLTRRINCRIPDCGIDRAEPSQLQCVVGHLRKERPDLLLVPYWKDDHPDHIEGSHLAVRARYLAGLANYPPAAEPFRVPTVLFYPCRKIFQPTFVVDITDVYEVKERAVQSFSSQLDRGEGRRPTPLNSPLLLERLRGRALHFGRFAGVAMGEGYLATEPLLLGADNRLIARSE